jgi:hypothetical protein
MLEMSHGVLPTAPKAFGPAKENTEEASWFEALASPRLRQGKDIREMGHLKERAAGGDANTGRR